MQQFVVPQFIDVEDKIFGPVTIRQFIILLVAGGIIFLTYRFGDFALFATTLAGVGGLSLIVAFVKVNGQSFHYFLLNIIQTLRKPSLRVWQKSWTKEELDYYRKDTGISEVEQVQQKIPARKQHIRDLALVVNTGGFYNPNE